MLFHYDSEPFKCKIVYFTKASAASVYNVNTKKQAYKLFECLILTTRECVCSCVIERERVFSYFIRIMCIMLGYMQTSADACSTICKTIPLMGKGQHIHQHQQQYGRHKNVAADLGALKETTKKNWCTKHSYRSNYLILLKIRFSVFFIVDVEVADTVNASLLSTILSNTRN